MDALSELRVAPFASAELELQSCAPELLVSLFSIPRERMTEVRSFTDHPIASDHQIARSFSVPPW